MKIKKLLSFLLVVCMMMGICSFSVFAAGGTVQINNTVLSFDEIIYVSVNGDDSTGDGTEENPYLSIAKAKSSITGSNACIYLLDEGTYPVISLMAGMANRSANTELTYIANPQYAGKIIVNLQGVGTAALWYKTTFIDIVFYKTGGDTRVLLDYTNNGSRWENYFYNCVFRSSANATDLSYPGNNDVSSTIIAYRFFNCAFDSTANLVSGRLELNHGAVNTISKLNGEFPKGFSYVTSLYKGQLDETYNILNPEEQWKNVGTGTNPDGTQANIGVYGGQYAWGYTGSTTPTVDGFYLVLEVDETITASVSDDLSDNALFDWRSSSEAVATVDVAGVITAKTPGTTIITCENSDEDFIDTIPVLVVEKGKAKEYRLAVTLSPNKTCQLTYRNLENLNWVSNDATIATVDANGKVTATAKGLAYVTVKDDEDVEVGKIYVRVI